MKKANFEFTEEELREQNTPKLHKSWLEHAEDLKHIKSIKSTQDYLMGVEDLQRRIDDIIDEFIIYDCKTKPKVELVCKLHELIENIKAK